MTFRTAFPRDLDVLDRARRWMGWGVMWMLVLKLWDLGPVRGDSVVVFNEIMYHPPDEEIAREWVELYNQNAVDVDLGGWRIAGGIDYEFPKGAVIPGGGFVWVALDPGYWKTQPGVSNVFGPFRGRLSNNGERLELWNSGRRRMDVVEYGVDGDWPVGPDGGGTSLVKKSPVLASGDARNWTESQQPGGTPGYSNLARSWYRGTRWVPVNWESEWRFWDEGFEPDPNWRESAYVDTAWRAGKALFQDGTDAFSKPVSTVLPSGRTTYYFRKTFIWNADPGRLEWALRSFADDGVVYYLNGQEVARWNMPTGVVNAATPAATVVGQPSVVGPIVLNATLFQRGTNVLAAEVHQRVSSTNSGLRVTASSGFRVSWDGVDGGFGRAETGASVPSNAALASAGAVISVSSNPQLAHRLQDGIYGNTSAWYPLPQESNPGVVLSFPSATLVTNIAWSRDNGNVLETDCGGTCTDRSLRTYAVAYTLSPNPTLALANSSNPTNGWVNLATMQYLSEQPGFTPHWRHRFSLSRTDGSGLTATGIRIRTAGALDELEVNTPGAPLFDAAFDAELSAVEILDPPPRIRFSEVSAAGSAGFWVELRNEGSETVQLEGMELRRRGGQDPVYRFPTQTLAPGALLVVPRLTLGFGASAGQKLFLSSTSGFALLDSVVIRDWPQARWEPGSAAAGGQDRDSWLVPSSVTPGSANQIQLRDEIVIHEVMYRHRTVASTHLLDARVTVDSPEEWIELRNRSAKPVDLGGWSLAGGVRWVIPAQTLIGAGDYLVLARDAAALRLKWPEVASKIVGDFSGKLGVGEEVRLLDASGNPAGRMSIWPQGWSNGDGSSLELLNVDADTSSPESWRASDESRRSEWQEVRYRMTAGQRFGASFWNEFRLGLLDAGEIWVDDVQLISDPDGARKNLIQNGNFESSETNSHWRCLGNHDGSVIETDPQQPSNHVLKIRAVSAARTGHNHVETTLLGNARLVDGKEYEVAFRARWMGGCAQIQSLAYFQKLARTTLLPQPMRHGTPGAANSVTSTEVGPWIQSARHEPVIPRVNEIVRISARITDPEGMGSARIYYRVNPATNFVSVDMTPGEDSRWVGELPGQTAGKIVQFYIESKDSKGNASQWPPGGPESRALYQVADNQGSTVRAHEIRLIQLNVDRDTMFRPTNLLSQARLGGTLIYNRQEVFYDVGVRLHGSAAGRARDGDDYISYDIEFPPDHLFRGVQDNIAIDRSGRSPVVRQQDEIYVLNMFDRAGLPVHHVDLCLFIAPKTLHTGTAILQLGGYNSLFMEEQLQTEGSIFNYDLTYEPSTTVNGNVEALKLPVPLQEHLGTDLVSLGKDKEQYRGPFNLRSGEREDDYSGIIRMCEVGGLPQAQFEAAVEQAWDVDEIQRMTALNILCGSGDQYVSATPSLPHNLRIFTPFDGGPAQFLPWDMDFVFLQDPTGPIFPTSSANLSKITGSNGLKRRYLWHVNDLCENVFNVDVMSRWIQHYGSVVRQDYSPALTYIQTRRATAYAQIPRPLPFVITTGAGLPVLTNTATLSVQGRAWIDVGSIRLRGETNALKITWTSLTNWTVQVPLELGANLVVLEGLTDQGAVVGQGELKVTSSATTGWADSDNDGMSDVWERANGFNVSVKDSEGDADGDGKSNLEEFWAGTNPQDRGSRLELSIQPGNEEGRVVLGWQVRPGRRYLLQERDTLGAGGEWLTVMTVGPEVEERTNEWKPSTTGSGEKWYRLVVEGF